MYLVRPPGKIIVITSVVVVTVVTMIWMLSKNVNVVVVGVVTTEVAVF